MGSVLIYQGWIDGNSITASVTLDQGIDNFTGNCAREIEAHGFPIITDTFKSHSHQSN